MRPILNNSFFAREILIYFELQGGVLEIKVFQINDFDDNSIEVEKFAGFELVPAMSNNRYVHCTISRMKL